MKKIICIITVLLLVGVIVNIYIGVNGNPIYINQAEKDMKVYLEKNYPNKDYKVGKVYYSMSFGSYTAKVTSPTDASVDFNLSWRSKAKVFIDEHADNIKMDSKDDALIKRFDSEISEDIKKQLLLEVAGVESVNAEIDISSGKYAADTLYSKEMAEKPTAWIYMKGERISKDNFADRCVKIRDILIENGYKFDSLVMQYNANFKGDAKGGGEEQYSLSLKSSNINLSKDEMLKDGTIYENKGKGKMILSQFLYEGVIAVFVIAVITAGIVIAFKERKLKA